MSIRRCHCSEWTALNTLIHALSVSPGPSGLPEDAGPCRASLFSLKSAGFKALC